MTNRKTIRRAAMLSAFLVGAAMATPAHALLIFTATLSGANERPTPVVSPGTGSVRIVINDALDSMQIAGEFADLVAPTTAAHIHCCAPATTAGPAVVDTPSLPGFPLGVQSGSFLQTFNLLDAATYSVGFVTANGGTASVARDRFVTEMLRDRTYFNVHSVTYPGGEIRGQLSQVPEPASWALMIFGFGAAGSALRRRQTGALA